MNDLGVPLFQDINGGYRLVPSNMLITWCLLTNPLLMFPAISVRWARAFPNDMFNHQRVSWLMLIKHDKNQYHDFSFSSQRKPRRNHVFLSWGWNHISVTEQRCEQKCMDDGNYFWVFRSQKWSISVEKNMISVRWYPTVLCFDGRFCHCFWVAKCVFFVSIKEPSRKDAEKDEFLLICSIMIHYVAQFY